MQAKRDQNHVTIGLGASTANNAVTLPLLVDPTSGYLLAAIYVVADDPLVTGEYTSRAKRDQNHRAMGLAVTDDANEDVRSLITSDDANKQYLFCDVVAI